jgi:selenocysteine lyase/cysteine desulfurase
LRPLVADLRAGIASAGLTPLTPAEPEYSSGIVSFAHEHGEEVAAALEREGVIVWGGDGRVRASVHLYNDAEDVERYLGALQRVLHG